jgi:predicted permease
LLARLHAEVGDETWTVDGLAIGLREQIVGHVALLLFLLLGASGLLLLIACANVANLLIARMAAREGELAVRVALGAGRRRLAQQLLVETSLLAFVGGAGGILLAALSVHTLLALRPALIPRVGELRVDWRVLAFAIVISAVTALALGLLTAWRAARGDLRAALSQSQRTLGGGGASYRIRGTLVVVQLATTVVLLIAAGLLAHSFERLVAIDPGFRDHGVVVADVAFDTDTGRIGIARRVQLADELMSRARSIPGVSSVGFSNAEPFSGGSSDGGFVVLSNADVKLTLQALVDQILHDKAHAGWANYRLVSTGYFKALGIPLVSGRLFDDDDRVETPHVAVVSASLARKQWPNENPIGKVIDFGNIDSDPTPMTIVGVVGDTREEDLADGPQPVVYCSYRQRRGNDDGMYLVLSSSNEAATIRDARQAFRSMRADLPIRFLTVEQIVGRSIASQRFMLLLIGVFGGVALLLATLGIYSVISYLVAQRGREISIRVALGASAPEVVRLVLRQGIALSLVGIAIGVAVALFATRVLRNLLYDVGPADPLAFAVVLALLATVVLLASYVPARRASRFDPMDVLRGG